jgi:hypothetical protein
MQVRFRLKTMLAVMAVSTAYSISLPQLLDGRNPPIANYVVSCIGGVLIARALEYRSIVAAAWGSGIGAAFGAGVPAFVLFMFPKIHTYARWGGYGVMLDFTGWVLVTILAFVAGAMFSLVVTLLMHCCTVPRD